MNIKGNGGGDHNLRDSKASICHTQFLLGFIIAHYDPRASLGKYVTNSWLLFDLKIKQSWTEAFISYY